MLALATVSSTSCAHALCTTHFFERHCVDACMSYTQRHLQLNVAGFCHDSHVAAIYTVILLLSCRVYGLVLWDYPLSDPRVLRWRHWRRRLAPSDCDPHMINTLGHLKLNHNNEAALDFVKPYDQSTWQDWRSSCLSQVLSRMQMSSLYAG
jgi:hypothetical protein